MKKYRIVIVLVCVLLSPSLVVVGQQGGGVSDDEALIKQHREDIQKLALKSPPPEAKAAHEQALAQLRKELRDLLLQKKGSLKKDIQDLKSPNASAAYQSYVKQLGDILKSVDDEILGLDKDLAGTGAIAIAIPSPSMSPSPGPPQPAPQTDEQKAVEADFQAKLASLSATDLKKAAAPKVMADASPPVDCNVLISNAQGFSKLEQNVCALAFAIRQRKLQKPPPPVTGITLQEDKGPLLPILVAKLLKTQGDASYVSFILEAEQARTDKQVGGGPGNSGTTSLVSKGGVPWAFGWAVENGAATESTNDTTITFRVNPVGAMKVLSNKGFLTGFREAESDTALNFLKKASIGLSFDTNRGDQPGTFTGKKQQLSAVSFRYEFVNQRDPRNKRYQRDWEQFVASRGVALAESVAATTVAVQIVTGPVGNREFRFKDPALQAWLEQTNRALNATEAGFDVLVPVLRKQIDLLPVEKVSDETTQAITNFAKGFEAYTLAKKDLLDKIAKGRLITFEYTNNRQVNAPDTSNFNFIAEGGTGRRIDFTANASLTMFNKKPVGLNINRIRDFQFAGQVDIPFGDVKGFGQPVFSFAGRYERLMENASTQAGTITPNTKGDIAFGQVKLTIPIKGTGFSLPISMTFANRTELIKEKDVRGNFGFTFDLDKILAKFKPF